MLVTNAGKKGNKARGAYYFLMHGVFWKYRRSPIASTNLVLKYTVFVNKFTLSTHDLDVLTSCIS